MDKSVLFRVKSESRSVDIVLNAYGDDTKNAEMFQRVLSSVMTISFDELLRQLEQFRGKYDKLKKFAESASEYLTKGRDVNSVLSAEYDAMAETEKNLFAKFYLDAVWSIYTEGREQLNTVGGALRNAVKNHRDDEVVRKRLSDTTDEMEQVVLTDWCYDHISGTDMTVRLCRTDLIALRGDSVNEVFMMSELSLLPMLYQYSYAVKSMELKVKECPYCRKHFLAQFTKVCCGDNVCMGKLSRDRANQTPEQVKKIKNDLYSYIRGLKHEVAALNKKMAVQLFEETQAKVKKYVKTTVDDYRDSDRLPDAEFDDVIEGARNTMRKLTDRIKRMSEAEIAEAYDREVNGVIEGM